MHYEGYEKVFQLFLLLRSLIRTASMLLLLFVYSFAPTSNERSVLEELNCDTAFVKGTAGCVTVGIFILDWDLCGEYLD